MTHEKIVGIGRTAEIIRIGKDKVMKLSINSFQRDHVEYEYKLCKIIQEKLENVPQVFDLIEKNGRLGIVFEYI
ncbi:MAG: aminoglycoside phosphotransferase, partial [Promethearchaeota archaeon]